MEEDSKQAREFVLVTNKMTGRQTVRHRGADCLTEIESQDTMSVHRGGVDGPEQNPCRACQTARGKGKNAVALEQEGGDH